MNQEDDLKSKFARTLRQNLNSVLDSIKDFDERGGIRTVLDNFIEEPGGWETIGQDPPDGYSAPKSGEKTLREYYANLEVEYGADLDTVKASYRELLRRYHPDKYANDPQMEALATELTQELTRAYRAVESYLKTGRY